MFAVGLADVFHRRILIVEDDPTIAEMLVQFVQSNGGEAIGPVACTRKAMTIVETCSEVDCVMVGAELRDDLALPFVRQLARQHLPIIWIIGHDGRFLPGADAAQVASVYRLAGDPQDVMRVSRTS